MDHIELEKVFKKQLGSFNHPNSKIEPVLEVPFDMLKVNIDKALEVKGQLEIWKGGKTKMI